MSIENGNKHELKRLPDIIFKKIFLAVIFQVLFNLKFALEHLRLVYLLQYL